MWTEELEHEVRELLTAGQRIEAYKLVYEKMRLKFLSEARQVGTDFEARMRLTTPDLALQPPLSDDLEEEVRKLLPDGKIEAVKRVREETGWGLKEAKDAVEDIQYNRTPIPDNVGWFTWHEVRKLMLANDKPTAAKMLATELGIEMAIAFKVAEAVKTGVIPVPKRPPKYRSIDD